MKNKSTNSMSDSGVRIWTLRFLVILGIFLKGTIRALELIDVTILGEVQTLNLTSFTIMWWIWISFRVFRTHKRISFNLKKCFAKWIDDLPGLCLKQRAAWSGCYWLAKTFVFSSGKTCIFYISNKKKFFFFDNRQRPSY